MNRTFSLLVLLNSLTFSSLALAGLIEVVAADGTRLVLPSDESIQLTSAQLPVVAGKLRVGDVLIRSDGSPLTIIEVNVISDESQPEHDIHGDAIDSRSGIDLGIQQRNFGFGMQDSQPVLTPVLRMDEPIQIIPEPRVVYTQDERVTFAVRRQIADSYEQRRAFMRNIIRQMPYLFVPTIERGLVLFETEPVDIDVSHLPADDVTHFVNRLLREEPINQNELSPTMREIYKATQNRLVVRLITRKADLSLNSERASSLLGVDASGLFETEGVCGLEMSICSQILPNRGPHSIEQYGKDTEEILRELGYEIREGASSDE